ncbi:hypothetical protein [Ideonella margarita]|uniref:Uncharacterized protein n=1 Tax=Ideonella margarita TaxID=2984191 RepID=A0ABU9C5S3_9BURK
MSQSMPASVSPTDEPLFDVFATRRSGVSVDQVRQMALDQGQMPATKIDRLTQALATQPRVQLGKEVPRSRAHKARTDLEAIGLRVEVVPVLSLKPLGEDVVDPTTECPACGARADMGPERQCPACGVYVDKVNADLQLRKKLLEEERGRLEQTVAREQADAKKFNREAMEQAMRRQIRAELERQYGREQGRLARFAQQPAMVGVVVVSLAVLSFGLGFGATRLVGPSAGALVAKPRNIKVQDLDALLAQMNVAPPAAGDAEAGGGDMAEAAVMMASQQAEASLVRGLGQASPATRSAALAKALVDMEPGLPPAVVPAGDDVTAGLGAADKAQLVGTFALGLAEMGQARRGQEVLDTLKSWRARSSDTAVLARLLATELQIEAWAIQEAPAIETRRRTELLRTRLAGVTDALTRAEAGSAVAAVLARQPDLPDTLAQGFLQLASDSAKAIENDEQRSRAVTVWMQALGDTLAAQAERHAAAGHRATADGLAAQLVQLQQQTLPGPTSVHLLGLWHHTARTLGQRQAGEQALADALAQVGQMTSLDDRAAALQDLARITDSVAQPALAQAAEQVTDAARHANRPELQARALAALSLLASRHGQPEVASRWQRQALQVPGLAPQRAQQLRAELLVSGELARAGAQRHDGLYAQADDRLQKLAGVLL